MTDTDPFDVSHPFMAPCSSPTSKSCQSNQLHRLLFKEASLSTCQLIDGVEGVSLGRNSCNASPSRQRAPAFAFFCICFFCTEPSSPPSCKFSTSAFEVQRLLNDMTLGSTKTPGVFGKTWMWDVGFFLVPLCFYTWTS